MHDMSVTTGSSSSFSTQGFIKKYVFSLDHKVIGLQYYGLALVAVFIGMVLSWLMRLHLGWAALAIPRFATFLAKRRAGRRDDP